MLLTYAAVLDGDERRKEMITFSPGYFTRYLLGSWS